MGSEWPLMTLREAGVQLIDCEHRTPPAAEEGYPYIAIPQVRDGRLDLQGVRRISKQDFESWTRRAKPTQWDVILSRRCNPGETAVVPSGLECAIGQNLVLLRADGSRVLPEFLRWMVRGPSWWEQVRTFLNAGAVFDSLKCADIPNFVLPVPPLEEQQAIAHILGTLDDKIELNRRMNETLESIARALFQSWFVDFDPVRAKSEGRDPGVGKSVADLFPNSFDDSELGEIPAGWSVARLDEIAVLATNTINPGAEPDRVWEHYSIPAYDNGRKPARERGSEIKSNKYRVPPTSVLVSKLNPQIPRVWCPDVRDEAAAICSTEFMPFVPLEAEFRPWLYCLAASTGFQAAVADRATGSTGSRQRVSPAEIAKLPVILPPRDLIIRFGEVVSDMLSAIFRMCRETAVLAEIRNALLPKLVSGELRLPAALREK